MSNANDFEIWYGKLLKYNGADDDVVIPDSVTSIGNDAFRNCGSLTSVTFPDSVTSIGDRAFQRCSSLSNVTIPESVTSIGESAFGKCDSLKSVSIGNGVASIGEGVFFDCTSMAEIVVDAGNVVYTSVDGVLYNKDKTTLICCPGSKASLTIPDSVTSIGGGAFRNCNSLSSVTIPESVTSIGDGAFSFCKKLTSIKVPDGVTNIGEHTFFGCTGLEKITMPTSLTSVANSAFWGCDQLTIELPTALLAQKKRLPAFLTQMQLDYQVEDLPLIIMFQSGKQWDAMIYNFFSKRPQPDMTETISETFSEMLIYLKNNPNDQTKSGKQVVNFIRSYYQYLPPEKISEMLALLEVACAKELAALNDDDSLQAYLNGQPKEEAPVERLVREAMRQTSVEPEFKRAAPKGIKYANADGVCSAEVVQYLLHLSNAAWEHSAQTIKGAVYSVSMLTEKSTIVLDAVADQIAAELDRIELCAFLESLMMGGKYRPYIIAWAKYADEDSVARIAKQYKKMASGTSKERNFAKNIAIALTINDTHAAMLLADQAGMLDLYAKRRGMTADDLRDRYLSDVGLTPDGTKQYDLGSCVVTAVMQPDFSFIVQLPDGKTAKSLPKKGADPKKYDAANKDFTALKTSAKRILKNRFSVLFAEFLSGKARPAEAWHAAYESNPLLRHCATVVVWAQGKKTFVLGADGAIDSTEQPYTITEQPIKVAHPMEMSADDVTAWQKYFAAHGLKQPFAQVWEPVRKAEQIAPDRYTGCMIPYYRFMGQEKHGITVDDYDFHNEIIISLADCNANVERIDFSRHMIDANDCFEIKLFSFKKFTRQVNHLVAYFDRVTIFPRIHDDDMQVLAMADGFTLAQIMEFIKFAQEVNAVNVLAALLAYKNDRFADFDPIDEFTLEW